jgi:hypothetical protein
MQFTKVLVNHSQSSLAYPLPQYPLPQTERFKCHPTSISWVGT